MTTKSPHLPLHRFAVALTMASVVVLAIPQPAAANEAAAMGALKVAKHYYDKGEFKKAAERFHEAYGIHPNPAFLFNAARAEQRAFMLDKAEADFQEVLAKSKDAKMTSRAKLHIDEIHAYRARLKNQTAAADKAKQEAEKARKDAEKARLEAEKAKQKAQAEKAAGEAQGAQRVASGIVGMSLKEKLLYGVSGVLLVTSAITYGAAVSQRGQAVELESEIVGITDPGYREVKLQQHSDLVTSSASARTGAVILLALGGGLGWYTYAFGRPSAPKKDDKGDGKAAGGKVSLHVAPWFDGGGLTLQGAF